MKVEQTLRKYQQRSFNFHLFLEFFYIYVC